MSKPMGLTNLGNTCYMNATLQALYACEEFRESVIANSFQMPDFLTYALAVLFQTMREHQLLGDAQVITPTEFHRLFTHISGFQRGREHDVSEFYSILMMTMVEEYHVAALQVHRLLGPSMPFTVQEAWSVYMNSANNTYLAGILFGQFETRMRCSICNSRSRRWDSFATVSLTVPDVWRVPYGLSVQTLIDWDYSRAAPELVDVRCDDCGATQKWQYVFIAQTNQFLAIHFARFSYNRARNTISKNKRLVEVNPTIVVNGELFRVVAVVKHIGNTPQTGHYTAVCRVGERYFNFNDRIVTELRAVPSGRNWWSGGSSAAMDRNPFDSNDAYMVYYRKERGVEPVEGMASETSSENRPKYRNSCNLS